MLQALADWELANIMAVEAEQAAKPAIVAARGALLARAARASDALQTGLAACDQLPQPLGGGVRSPALVVAACLVVALRRIEAD